MIKTLFLPEASLRSKYSIDLPSSETLPGRTLSYDLRLPYQTHNNVHMIGHHDEAAQVVTIPVEV